MAYTPVLTPATGAGGTRVEVLSRRRLQQQQVVVFSTSTGNIELSIPTLNLSDNYSERPGLLHPLRRHSYFNIISYLKKIQQVFTPSCFY